MSSKTKYPRAAAIAVARELVAHLQPHCERLLVAGSLRRRKSEVGDVELLYLPRFKRDQVSVTVDLFAPTEPSGPLLNLANAALDALVHQAVILPRKNTLGSIVWGEKNKLARHTSSGIPVDLFAATEANWWNYVVCRTGSAENNVRLASAAQSKGWKWNPYGPGFTDQEGNLVRVHSEQDVYRLVGLPYLEPWQR